ncbi:MAG TPA: prolyl oligopeptidase family serine peptidase [Pseudomonadota bacterium]|nr:prolyl oligopeptidase family serine peptidase [Pseudomonadota bacterium]
MASDTPPPTKAAQEAANAVDAADAANAANAADAANAANAANAQHHTTDKEAVRHGLKQLASSYKVAKLMLWLSGIVFGARTLWRSTPEVTLPPSTLTLQTARAAFSTRLTKPEIPRSGAAPKPPAPFQPVRYPAKPGSLAGYLTADPGDGKRHPAVLWAHSGFQGIGEGLWGSTLMQRKASVRVLHEAGLVVFCPAFRGENDNPGRSELFYGELDDLLAARDFLAAQPFVSPERIYLIGNGISGGTLTLLAAVASDRFRSAIALGGAAELGRVVSEESSSALVPFDPSVVQESYLRSPLYFADFIKRPTFYFGPGDSFFRWDVRQMKIRAMERNVPFDAFFVEGVTEDELYPRVLALLARKIPADLGPQTDLKFSASDLATLSSTSKSTR